jgi:hypothetical protein
MIRSWVKLFRVRRTGSCRAVDKESVAMETGARGRRTVLGIAPVVAALLSAPAVAGAQSSAEFVPVTDEMLQNPADGDWLTWRRTLDGWGFRLGTWSNSLIKKAIRSLPTYSFPSFRPSF